MQADEDGADPCPVSRLDQSDSSGGPQWSSKLLDKLNKLANWRLDLSSIEFPEGTREFSGGFATVSRAYLAPASGTEDWVDGLDYAEGETKSGDGTSRRKNIAVKKLKIENENEKARVLGLALREAEFLVKLSHENITELEGFVEDGSNNRIWLVFPWAENGNLKDFVASEDWEIPERIWLIEDVTRGVEYLHSRDPPICHGDLKSVNVLVNSKYRAVITDFGSARRLTPKDLDTQSKRPENSYQPPLVFEATISETTNTITLTGNKYTLRWAAPELLMEAEPGLWSDIWALGWIFYEVMTNTIPFQNVQKDSLVIKHVMQGNLPSVNDHSRMLLIRALYSLMVGCWSIDPSKRLTAEECRKLMSQMPMIIPNPQRSPDAAAARTRSPELLVKLGYMHTHQSDQLNAFSCFTEALGMYKDVNNKAGEAEALLGLAYTHRCKFETSEAIAAYSEVIQVSTDIGNKLQRAHALSGLAESYRHQQQYPDAISSFSEALQIYTDIGSGDGRADALYGLATIYMFQNEDSEALELYSEAVQIFTDVGNRHGRANALWGLAKIHQLQGQDTQAIEILEEALQTFTDIGNELGRACALLSLANVHRDQDHHEDAIRLYEQAATAFEHAGNNQDAGMALDCAAQVRQRPEPMEAE